jgi:FeS assembly SUF system protein
MITKDMVIKKLKKVLDPELGINLVDLGLIYDVKIKKDDSVKIIMTLTTPGCPLAYVFDEMIGSAIRSIKGVKNVTIDLTFDPPWTSDKMSEDAKLQLGFVN